MPIEVEIEGFGTVEFPDGMSPAQVEEVLQGGIPYAPVENPIEGPGNFPDYGYERPLTDRDKRELRMRAMQAGWPQPDEMQEGGIGAQAKLGAVKGVPMLKSAVGGVLESISDVLNSPTFGPFISALTPKDKSGTSVVTKALTETSETGEEIREAANKETELVQYLIARTEGPKLVSDVTSTATSLVPTLLASPFGFAPMITAGSLHSYGSIYNEAEQSYKAAKDPLYREKARRDGLIGGIITAVVAGSYGKTGVEAILAARGNPAVKAAIKRVIVEGGHEASEEIIEEGLQAIAAKMSYDPNMTLEQAVHQLVVAGLAGSLLGSAANIPGEAGRTIQAQVGRVQLEVKRRKALADVQRALGEIESQMVDPQADVDPAATKRAEEAMAALDEVMGPVVERETELEKPDPQLQDVSGELQGAPEPAAEEFIGPTLPDPVQEEVKHKVSVEDRLARLKFDTRGKSFDVTLGLPVAVWNGGIDAVIGAVKAGRTIAQAIQDGIDYIVTHHKKGFAQESFRRLFYPHLTMAELAEAKAGKISEPKRVAAGENKGYYVGSPAINTPAKLSQLRGRLLKAAQRGEAGRYWYEESGKELMNIVGGNVEEADRLAQLVGIYSPQNQVIANMDMAERAYLMWQAGMPREQFESIILKDSTKQKDAASVLYDNKAWSGRKRNNFYNNLMAAIDPSRVQGVTADLWIARFFGYDNDVAGEAARYDFIQREIGRVAQQLEWEPQQVQAAIWVYTKNFWENLRPEMVAWAKKNKVPIRIPQRYKQGEKKGQIMKDKDGKPKMVPNPPFVEKYMKRFKAAKNKDLVAQEGYEVAQEDTVNFAQVMHRRPVFWSMEAQPGFNTGLLRGLHEADYETKLEFLMDIEEALRDPETGRDIIAQELGFGPLRTGSNAWVSRSVYRNSRNQIEINPARQLEGYAPSIKGGEGAQVMSRQARAMTEVYAMLYGYYTKQEAVAAYRPFEAPSINRSNMRRIQAARAMSEEELQSLNALIEENLPARDPEDPDWIIALYPTPDGVNVVNVFGTRPLPEKGEEIDTKAKKKKGAKEEWWEKKNDAFNRQMDYIINQWVAKHETLDVNHDRAAADTVYEYNDWSKDKDGQSYRQGIRSRFGPDVLARLDRRLPLRIQQVYEKWAQKGYGQAPQATFTQEAPATQEVLNEPTSVTPPSVAPVEQRLEALKQPLLEPQDFQAQPSDDQRLAKAKTRVKDAAGRFVQLGIIANPQEDAKKVWELYLALADLAKIYIERGVKSVGEFAQEIGTGVTTVMTRAFNDALNGDIKSEPNDLGEGFMQDAAQEFRTRKFSRRLEADDAIAYEIRQATGNAEYVPIPNVLTVQEAMAIVDTQGLGAALGIVKDERNGLPERVRITLGQAMIRKANQEYAKRTAGSDHALNLAVEVAEWLTAFGTRLGQGIQAFAIWKHLTPDGFVRTYKRTIDKARAALLQAQGLDPNKPVPPEVEKKLALPTFDKEFAKEILTQAQAAMAKPEGFQRDEMLMDILGSIARQRGLSMFDIGTALWYGNILSGWTTQARNFFGTMSNVIMEAFAHSAAHPTYIPDMMVGLYQGFIRGMNEAVSIMRTGKITGTRIKKLEIPRVLELVNFKGVAYPLNAWKYVFRVMAASDMMFFRSAEEMKMRFMARTLAHDKGLKGEELNKEIADQLHNTKAHKAAAQEQAKSEGLKKGSINYRRRVFEIMEQLRPDVLVNQAADYGRYATFNQEPDGVLGVLAHGIANATRQVPAIRLVVPFTHVVANVSNAALNWTPHGYLRLFNWGNIPGERAPDWGSDEFKVQAARATLGTLGMAAMYALALAHADDEDPFFAITGSGPPDPGKRHQLGAAGLKPYSIKIGSMVIPYQYTSLHMGLAMIGSILDAKKYQLLDDADALNRAWYVMHRIPGTILNQSFLKGLSDFFSSLSRDYVPKSGNKFGGLARATSSMVIPNLVKQIDRMFDPTVHDATTVQAAIIRDVPIARQGLRPMLNVLGDPVRIDKNPFFISMKGKDEIFKLLARKQAFITPASKMTMINERTIRPGEYYDYVKTSGKMIRAKLELKAPILESVDKETAQDLVRKWVREERRKAKKILFGVSK